MDHLDIQPASISQFVTARDGRLVEIPDDVGNVARSLREIDRGLRLAYSPDQDVSIVSLKDGDEERLVTTMQGRPDQRLVRRVREINSPSYDYVAELDKVEAEAKAKRAAEFRERVGDAGERLAHAIRKDTHDEGRVFLSGKRP